MYKTLSNWWRAINFNYTAVVTLRLSELFLHALGLNFQHKCVLISRGCLRIKTFCIFVLLSKLKQNYINKQNLKPIFLQCAFDDYPVTLFAHSNIYYNIGTTWTIPQAYQIISTRWYLFSPVTRLFASQYPRIRDSLYSDSFYYDF